MLSQRLRITQAARLREDLIARHGDAGAFPTPRVLRQADLDLPGRKNDYLQAVADAALEGRLDTAALRRLPPDHAMTAVQDIKGLGPFGAELVVLRGANTTDTLPRHEHRLNTVVAQLYGPDGPLTELSRPGARSAPGQLSTSAPWANALGTRGRFLRCPAAASQPTGWASNRAART